MRRPARTLWLALPVAALVGCADDPVVEAPTDTGPEAVATTEVDPGAARAEIEAANRQAVDALNRGDVRAFVQVYAEDARILPPEMAPAEGREAIEQFWAGGVQQLGLGGAQLSSVEVEVFGETAYEQGRYQFTTNQGPAQGKYVVIWSRTPEGWRWHRHIWNPSPAAG